MSDDGRSSRDSDLRWVILAVVLVGVAILGVMAVAVMFFFIPVGAVGGESECVFVVGEHAPGEKPTAFVTTTEPC